MQKEIFKKIGGFNSPVFGELSIIAQGTSAEPWFLAKDVTRILQINKKQERFYARIPKKYIRKELVEVPISNQFGLTGGTQIVEANVLSEAGLYFAIFTSTKTIAEGFREWIIEEVTPSLRQHGMYIDPELADELVNCGGAQKFLEKYRRAQSFYEGYCDIDEEGAVLIRDYVKLLNQSGIKTSQSEFHRYLINNGYVCKSKGSRYFATKRYSDQGFFKTTLVNKLDSKGVVRRFPTGLRITQKGQSYFYNLLKDCSL